MLILASIGPGKMLVAFRLLTRAVLRYSKGLGDFPNHFNLLQVQLGDGAEFLGPAGYPELQQFGEEALLYIKEAFRSETGIEGNELEEYFQGFDRNHGPTAYVFRCRHCRKLGGYWDSH